MTKSFMPELEPEQRLQALKDNADSVENTEYYKDLSQEDLDVKRETLTSNLIQLSEWEDELGDIKDAFKRKMKPLKDQDKQLITEVKTRKQLIEGTLYHMADHEAGIMETFDQDGEFVSSRRLRPDEKQPKLFPVRQSATN